LKKKLYKKIKNKKYQLIEWESTLKKIKIKDNYFFLLKVKLNQLNVKGYNWKKKNYNKGSKIKN
jgi:hypothetical protein